MSEKVALQICACLAAAATMSATTNTMTQDQNLTSRAICSYCTHVYICSYCTHGYACALDRKLKRTSFLGFSKQPFETLQLTSA